MNRTINTRSLTLIVIAAASLAATAQAETTPELNRVAVEIARTGRFDVRTSDTVATIVDRRTGSDLASVTAVSETQIVVSATVAQVATTDEATRRAIHERVDMFNTSAPAGTLRYDEATGTVTITYNANPRYASPAAIAGAITLVADAVGNESTVIAAIVNGVDDECTNNLLCNR
jgi:hypothetical protein